MLTVASDDNSGDILLATLTLAALSSEKLITNTTDSVFVFLITDNAFLSLETTVTVLPSLRVGEFVFKFTKFL